MARYKIYDNKSDVITPVGEKLTAEQWLDRYQWGRYTKMIVGGGIINGSVALVFDDEVERYRKAGCDFSSCTTDEDYLAAIEVNGGLWAVVGMTMSTVMESKYIAYASPFIVYYLLVILYERYFPNAWPLYPKNWLNPEIWPYGVGSAALFLLELMFLCGLVFYIRGKRRLEQL